MSGTPDLRRRRPTSTRTAEKDVSGDSQQPTERLPASFSPPALFDLLVTISLVFGGCCVNVWSFEELLRMSSHVGSAITFAQMLFITLQSLPGFITWHTARASGIPLLVPTLVPRHVPLLQWALQVSVLTSGTLLNNWAFAYDIPLTLQIVFRSSGLPVSLLLGRLFLKKSYSIAQVASVLVVSLGVVLATISRPNTRVEQSSNDAHKYSIGIAMLSVSLFLSGLLGVLQERTYRKHGPCWREGVFYTHLLSLPVFVFLAKDVVAGFTLLAGTHKSVYPVPRSAVMMLINLSTQLICVTGVNQLTSKVSSVSTNLVLTTRKALSLCLSVFLFRSGWNAGLVGGAGMVFAGSLLYTIVTAS